MNYKSDNQSIICYNKVMELIQKRATVLYVYWLIIGLLLAGLLLMLPVSFANPVVFSIAVLYLICFPGFLIMRLFRYQSEHLIFQFLLYFFPRIFYHSCFFFICFFEKTKGLKKLRGKIKKKPAKSKPIINQ